MAVEEMADDSIASELLQLRAEYGAISYKTICRRIASNRLENGGSLAAAQVAPSSVYDLFTTSRKRRNATLVAEVVLAITGDEQESQRWLKRCGYLASGLNEDSAENDGKQEFNIEIALHPELYAQLTDRAAAENISAAAWARQALERQLQTP